MKYEINIGNHACLGDAIAAISSGIYISEMKDVKVGIYTKHFAGLVKLYNNSKIIANDILSHKSAYLQRVNKFHMTKNNANGHNNYVGAFIAALGVKVKGIPEIICPPMDTIPLFSNKKYCVLQPYAGTMRKYNLTNEQLQSIIDYISEKYNINVVIGGHTNTPQVLQNVIYMLGNYEVYFKLVSNAKFSLGPESSIAHISASYNVPAVIWRAEQRSPFMWLFNYPNWDKWLCDNNPNALRYAIDKLIDESISITGIDSTINETSKAKHISKCDTNISIKNDNYYVPHNTCLYHNGKKQYTALSFDLFLEKISLIRSACIGEHGWFLYALIRELKPKVLLEVGAYHGYSTCWIARAIHDNGIGHLWTIDNFSECDRTTLEKNLQSTEVKEHVTILEGDCKKVLLSDKLPKDINFAFIDANNSYVGVKGNVVAILNKSDCILTLVLHDSISWWGVRKYTEEIRNNWKRSDWDIIELHASEGLLCLKKNCSKPPMKYNEKSFPKGSFL